MRTTLLSALLCLLLSNSADSVSPNERERLNGLGDATHWRIVGAETFPVEELRKRLENDLEVLLANRPSTPAAQFAETLRRRLSDGYRHAGFDKVAVEANVDLDRKQIVLRVEEGPQFAAGQILVIGVTPDLGATIVNRLTKPFWPDAPPRRFVDEGEVLTWINADDETVEKQAPLWVVGAPVHFDEGSCEHIERRVREVLAESGISKAECRCSVVRHDTQADLRIEVTALGPPTILRGVVVRGNHRDTKQDILQYLGIETGVAITPVDTRRWERTLWESGRFIRQKVTTHQLPAGAGVELHVDVQEYAEATRLAEPLTRQETALLRHYAWLVNGNWREYDLVAQLSHETGHCEVILGSAGGIVSLWENEAQDVPQHAMIVMDQQLACYSLANQQKCVWPTSQVQLRGFLSFQLSPDPGRRFQTRIRFGASQRSGERFPLRLRVSLAPSYLIALAHEDEAECSWQGSTLTIQTATETLRIHEDTGQLLERNIAGVAVSFEPAALKRRTQQILRASATHKEAFDPNQPFTSTCRFLCSTDMLQAVSDVLQRKTGDDVLQTATQLLNAGIAAPLDQLIAGIWGASTKDKFSIPSRRDVTSVDQRTVAKAAAVMALRQVDECFVKGSWGHHGLKSLALTILGEKQLALQELPSLVLDEQLGPTGNWLLAEALYTQGRPAGYAVTRGLQPPCFNRQAFIEEWSSTLNPLLQSRVGRSLKTLKVLTDEEARRVADWTGCPSEILVHLVSRVRESETELDRETISLLLEVIWDHYAAEHLQNRLETLATQQTAKRVADRRAQKRRDKSGKNERRRTRRYPNVQSMSESLLKRLDEIEAQLKSERDGDDQHR